MDTATQAAWGDRMIAMLKADTTQLERREYRQPVAHYIDPAHAARERATLFRRTPLIVAASSEMESPGDFRVVDIDGLSILLTRQSDGTLKAFHNVCRHRGCRVVDEECGRRPTFTCKFHSWVYGGDGALRHVPGAEGFPNLDRAASGLVALPVAERHGLVWVTPTAGPPIDIDAFLGPIGPVLAEMRIAEAGVFRFERFGEALNWKLVVDTFLELYHVPYLHSRTVGRFIEGRGGIYERLGRHGRFVAPRMTFLAALADTPSAERDVAGHIVGIHRVFPNAVVVWQRDHVEFWTAVPDGDDPNRCVVRLWLLSPEKTVTDSDRAKWNKNWDIVRGTVHAEDFPMARTIQQGFSSGAQSHVVFGRNEPGLHDFHRSLDEALTAG
ncbi:MAG: aromatic ring-hydroxylating dioxygenase subunit alpha [Rhodospirillales bacterium]|nr:MAG: aromatic ring-hydroxylating dioxygenase subunit alpha [Rhodospirillales bacterium]